MALTLTLSLTLALALALTLTLTQIPEKRTGGAAFLHEREVALATTLDDAAFGAFMGAQCGQLELWSAPAGAARHNLFKHTLLI